MNPLRILIVEDELIEAQDLSEILASMGYVVTARVPDSTAALIAFAKDPPDLIILDIQLGDSKLDGIQLATAFNKIKRIPIIFLTAHRDESIRQRALSIRPANYLLKPYDEDQLIATLDHAIKLFATNQSPNNFDERARNQKNSIYPIDDYFFLKQDLVNIKINIPEIRWVKANNNRVCIVTARKEVSCGVNLKKFEAQVPSRDLIRIHKSYIINIRHVESFAEGMVIIPDGTTTGKRIPIGDQYRAAFHARIPKLKG